MDWTLFARFAAPIIALFVGAFLNRLLERHPKLVTYYAHTASVAIQPPEGDAFNVHTHSIVIRNAGRKPATNIRLGHYYLPNFTVFPAISYEVLDLPGGGKEILIPSLVPGEQLTVAYLYYPPVLWSNVNSYAKSDEAFAKVVHVLPTPQPAVWLRRLAFALMTLGAMTALYALGELILFMAGRSWHDG